MTKYLSTISLRNACHSLRARDIAPFPGHEYQVWLGKNIKFWKDDPVLSLPGIVAGNVFAGAVLHEAPEESSIGEDEAFMFGVALDGKLIKHKIEFFPIDTKEKRI